MAQFESESGKPVHVVHVIGALQTGGAEKMLVNFLGAVDKTRYRHTVICLSARGDLSPDVEALGIPVVLFPVRMRHILRDIRALSSWFRKHKVRIIHSHMFYASFWSRLAGLSARVPVMVTTEHGKEPWKKKWQSWLDRYLSGKSHHHIAVSEDVRTIRIERDGIDPGRITMIPNGVPLPPLDLISDTREETRREFGIASDTLVLGSVGRMIEAKAYPDLLKALGIARQRVPDLYWLQVGDGPGRDELIRLAEMEGLSAAVTFAGRRSDIPRLLAAMDIWVMSSIREGLPVALLEAMAASKPIVATDVGGIPDAVTSDVEALLVPANVPESLASAICSVAGDRELARRLGTAARARAEKDYGIEAVASRIEELYESGLRR